MSLLSRSIQQLSLLSPGDAGAPQGARVGTRTEGYEVESVQPLIDAVRAEYDLLRACVQAQYGSIGLREDTEFHVFV